MQRQMYAKIVRKSCLTPVQKIKAKNRRWDKWSMMCDMHKTCKISNLEHAWTKQVVKLCCDCKAPNGLRPCTLPASGSSFIVETTTCFFDKLPPLKFGNYVQCLICGRRFEDEDYKHHDVLCKKKFNLYPDSETVEQRKFIKKSNRPRKYKPPFFMKTLRYDLEVDDCPRDQDLCGFFDY